MSETIVEGLQAVADHFKKSVRQIRNWRRQGMPVLSGDRYDLVQIEAWRSQKKGVRGPAAPEDPRTHGQMPLVAEGDKDYQDMRAKKAQADLRELQLRKLRGEVIELAEVEALLAPRAMAYRQGIVAMQTLAPEIGLKFSLPPEAVRVIASMIGQRGREVLANVLRPLTLESGQVLEWGQELPQGGG